MNSVGLFQVKTLTDTVVLEVRGSGQKRVASNRMARLLRVETDA